MPQAIQKAKKTKKQRKFGRQANSCLRYAREHRRERNKLKRLAKHLKRFPDDQCAVKAVEACQLVLPGSSNWSRND